MFAALTKRNYLFKNIERRRNKGEARRRVRLGGNCRFKSLRFPTGERGSIFNARASVTGRETNFQA